MFQLVQNQSSGDIKYAFFLFLVREILTVRSGSNRILSTLHKCLFAETLYDPPGLPLLRAVDVVYALSLIKLLGSECGMISMLAVIACRDSNSPLS